MCQVAEAKVLTDYLNDGGTSDAVFEGLSKFLSGELNSYATAMHHLSTIVFAVAEARAAGCVWNGHKPQFACLRKTVGFYVYRSLPRGICAEHAAVAEDSEYKVQVFRFQDVA